jgi:hypothetical protein
MKIAIMLALAAALSFAADPFVGTWKAAQPDKWKISPGGKAEERKSLLVTTELISKNKYRETTTTLNGSPVDDHPPFTYVRDGKERRSINNTTVKYELMEERHGRATIKGEKGTVVDDLIVSPDGKTATVTRKGTGPTTGRQIDEQFFYERIK